MAPTFLHKKSKIFHRKIRNVLILYYLTPILCVVLISGVVFYHTTKKSLDEELGHRLKSVSLASAAQVRDYHLAALTLKNFDHPIVVRLRNRLVQIRDDNEVEAIYIFDSQNRSLLDTHETISSGTVYERNRLYREELQEVQKGQAMSCMLFQGKDGAFYKSAFAPVQSQNQTIAMVGVDGSATFFKNLDLLGQRLAFFVLTCIGVIILVSMIISRKIVTPIQSLVDGAQRIGEGNLQMPIVVRSENELGFLAHVLDEMRKNIVSRDREMQVMLRGIAHEVRNPLGGMELFAGIIQEEAKDPEIQKAITRIQNEIKTLKTLVEDFLDFARNTSLQKTLVDLPFFFHDLELTFRNDLQKKNIQWITNFNHVNTIFFDADQIRRVFLNVIHNSIHAISHQQGRIEIQTRDIHGNVEIRVIDNGVGVPQENLDKLFDPFFTTKEKGTGLGLSFARKIVTAHAGEIFAQSEGQGTQVVVLLP